MPSRTSCRLSGVASTAINIGEPSGAGGFGHGASRPLLHCGLEEFTEGGERCTRVELRHQLPDEVGIDVAGEGVAHVLRFLQLPSETSQAAAPSSCEYRTNASM
jgi:hypothetical protein